MSGLTSRFVCGQTFLVSMIPVLLFLVKAILTSSHEKWFFVLYIETLFAWKNAVLKKWPNMHQKIFSVARLCHQKIHMVTNSKLLVTNHWWKSKSKLMWGSLLASLNILHVTISISFLCILEKIEWNSSYVIYIINSSKWLTISILFLFIKFNLNYYYYYF